MRLPGLQYAPPAPPGPAEPGGGGEGGGGRPLARRGPRGGWRGALGGGGGRLRGEAGEPILAWLERAGEVPLPPYIRRPAGPTSLDRERYQTLHARVPGAVAAP